MCCKFNSRGIASELMVKWQSQQSKRRGKANEARDVAKVMIDSCGLANANSKQAKVSNRELL